MIALTQRPLHVIHADVSDCIDRNTRTLTRSSGVMPASSVR